MNRKIWNKTWTKKSPLFAVVFSNAVNFTSPPSWLTNSLVEGTVHKIEGQLEWSTRRVTATFYRDPATYAQALGKTVPGALMAFTRRSDQSMHFGPLVTAQNFKVVFGHELAHVITFQKYAGKIPLWLEEGLANYSAGHENIDWPWLAKQKPLPVKSLSHPLTAAHADAVKFQYVASLGVLLMLKEKCPSYRELLNLSLRKNLEEAISSYCGIKDLNSTFWAYVKKKGN